MFRRKKDAEELSCGFEVYLKWYFSVVLNFVQSNAIIDMDKMD